MGKAASFDAAFDGRGLADVGAHFGEGVSAFHEKSEEQHT